MTTKPRLPKESPVVVLGDCSGDCREEFALHLDTGEVEMVVPSNGIRGSKHVPAHKVSTQAYFDRVDYSGGLWQWDCPFPGCGYAESEEVSG